MCTWEGLLQERPVSKDVAPLDVAQEPNVTPAEKKKEMKQQGCGSSRGGSRTQCMFTTGRKKVEDESARLWLKVRWLKNSNNCMRAPNTNSSTRFSGCELTAQNMPHFHARRSCGWACLARLVDIRGALALLGETLLLHASIRRAKPNIFTDSGTC